LESWRKNLYTVWSAQFIAAVGLNLVVPFLPLFLRELGVEGDKSLKIWSGVVYAAPFLVSALMQPLWGILGDRVGRKPMIARAMLGLSAAHFLMGISTSATQFLIFRIFQGCLSGFIAPSLALVASSAPPNKTGFALATLQTAFISSLIVGPFLGGGLIHFMGCRPIFHITGVLCLFGAIVVFLFVREEFEGRKDEAKSELRQNFRHVFYTADLRRLFLLLIIIQSSIFFVASFLSLYVELLDVPQEYTGLMTGAVFGITGVTSAIMAPFWGGRADRIGYGKVLRIALVGMTAFLLPQALVTNAWQLMFCRAGLGIFISGAVPMINSIVRISTEENERGGIYGIFQSGLLLGNMIGPLIGGYLAAYLGLRAVFVITTGVLASGWLLLRGSRD
jgi:MFS family permease